MKEKDNLSIEKLENVFGGIKLAEGQIQVDIGNSTEYPEDGLGRRKVRLIDVFIPEGIDVKGGYLFVDQELNAQIKGAAVGALKKMLKEKGGTYSNPYARSIVRFEGTKAPDGMQAICVKCYYIS